MAQDSTIYPLSIDKKNVRIIRITPLIHGQNFFWENYALFENLLISFSELQYFSDLDESILVEEEKENDFILVNVTSWKQKAKNSVFNLSKEDSVISNLHCFCVQSLLKDTLKINAIVQLKMDAQVFANVIHELQQSATLCKYVVQNFFNIYKKRKQKPSHFSSFDCSACSWKLELLILYISVSWPEQHFLNKSWNSRIQVLINEKCELENAMAWLSTLGGAYSSLGDYDEYFAERAETISFKQLKIALKLGDPCTVARCNIYLAMSLLQRGYFKQTKKIIREQYKFSQSTEGKKDFKLANMCKSVWIKLQYLKSLLSSSSKMSQN